MIKLALAIAGLLGSASIAIAQCAPGYDFVQIPVCTLTNFTVGYTTIPTAGTGNSYTAGYSFANGPYTMPQDGVVQSCSIWFASVAGGQVQCGVYGVDANNKPSTLIARSASFTPVAGWNTKPTLTTPTITGGTVIFMAGLATVNTPTRADATTGFTLYGDNGGDTNLKDPMLSPPNTDATNFQLGAYITFACVPQ